MKHVKDDRGYNQIWVTNEATRVREERRCDYLISQLDLPSGGKVLEIGCGLGAIAWMIAQKTGANVLGTDLCLPFIRQAREKYHLPNLRYEVRDFNRSDQFGDENFDCIVGNGILHHLYSELDDALASMKLLLNPGGRIIFLEPNIYNPYIYLIFSCSWLRRRACLEPGEMAFSRRFITAKLRRAGFREIKVEFRDFLLPGIPSFLIRPSVLIGDILEKMPVLNRMAQSIFIRAQK